MFFPEDRMLSFYFFLIFSLCHMYCRCRLGGNFDHRIFFFRVSYKKNNKESFRIQFICHLLSYAAAVVYPFHFSRLCASSFIFCNLVLHCNVAYDNSFKKFVRNTSKVEYFFQ